MFWGHFGPLLGSGNSLHRPFPYRCRAANLSVLRFQKGFGATLGHFGAFLGAKVVQDSPTMASRWLKMASTWPKMTPRWPQDGLRWPQDGPKMAQHRPLGPSWAILGPSWGQFGANLAPCWANLGSSCTPPGKISIFHWFSNDFKVNPGPLGSLRVSI